jgi:hypothetical protein
MAAQRQRERRQHSDQVDAQLLADEKCERCDKNRQEDALFESDLHLASSPKERQEQPAFVA